jgi:hypothetical protein
MNTGFRCGFRLRAHLLKWNQKRRKQLLTAATPRKSADEREMIGIATDRHCAWQVGVE